MILLVAAGFALLGAAAVCLVPDAARRKEVRIDSAGRGGEWPMILRLWSIAFVTAAAVGAFEVGLSLRGKQTLGMDTFQVGMMFTECGLVMFIVQALVLSPLIRPQITRWFLAPALVTLAIGLIPYRHDYRHRPRRRQCRRRFSDRDILGVVSCWPNARS